MSGFEDKVVLVTGARRGIGREIALTFAREGANLAICSLSCPPDDLAAEIKCLGREVISLKVDVANSAQVDEMTKKILDKFKKIDILVNNAGMTQDNLLLRMSEDNWDRVIAVNLKGTFNVVKSVSRAMLRQRQGKIVNIASIIGLIGNVGQANYAASKAGIIALTKSLAKEFAGRNICVNALAPGFIDTDMTAALPDDKKKEMLERIPLGRFGRPGDVANTCLFLAGGASDYITGQVVVVDGGMVM